jgi:DNA repair photolyase
MVELVPIQRRSAVLVASKLPCMGRMPAINLTAGCAHECVYCYAQGYCSYPGRGRVFLYANLLEKLRHELASKRNKPAAVMFSPSSDPFQPLPEVLDLAFSVMEYLLRSGIGVIFLTKGKIPRRHLDLFAAHAPLVRAHVGITTLDRRQSRMVEPGAASPLARLKQMQALVAGGVATQARLDPILPGLTDRPDGLHALCAALSKAGITEISASTLFLRPALVSALRQQLDRAEMPGAPRNQSTLNRLLAAFARARWLRIGGGGAAILALPPARRRLIFNWLSTIARQYDIAVHVCGCKNPDLGAGQCDMAGLWSPPATARHQLALFP